MDVGTTKKRGSAWKHGASKPGNDWHRAFRVWNQMRQRCHNPNDSSYRFYGERGVFVCDEWRASFDAFVSYIRGILHEGATDIPKGLTVDRIDSLAGYAPGNVRFLTIQQQQRNRRSNRRVEINGETKLVSDWLEEFKVPFSTYYTRLQRGWSLVEAITTPPDEFKSKNAKQWQARRWGRVKQEAAGQ